jgi:hypothetical protein
MQPLQALIHRQLAVAATAGDVSISLAGQRHTAWTQVRRLHRSSVEGAAVYSLAANG